MLEVAAQLAVNPDTLRKAVRAGRLRAAVKNEMDPAGGAGAAVLTTKSKRSQPDAQTPLGVAIHDMAVRMLASLGQSGPVASCFEPCADAPKAGVLLAVPALLASGLWQHNEEHFQLPPGYYRLVHLVLLVALFCAGSDQVAGELVLLCMLRANGARCWAWSEFRRCARCGRNCNGASSRF